MTMANAGRLSAAVFAALALALAAAVAGPSRAEDYPVSQGWTQREMRDWYGLTQGSRLIRMDWLAALARADGAPFLSRKTLEAYGYLYFKGSEDLLPIGFIEDVDRQGVIHLGFNCAACHTSKLSGNGAEVFVHGGSTMSDLQAFTTDLVDAAEAAEKDDSAFTAFAGKVLGAEAGDAARAKLREEMRAWLDIRKSINDTGKDSHWGRGRSDAVGIILATVGKLVDDPAQPADSKRPFPASNAPVSYPFVWNANQQARLQHNGVVDNGTDFGVVKVAKIGALIRNWTEAFGVFAQSRLSDDAKTVETSIRLDNLMRIEQALSVLQSPKWPDAFGPIDAARAARGAVLFKDNCGGCHGQLAAGDTKTDLPLAGKPGSAATPGFIYMQPLFPANARPEDFVADIKVPADYIGTDPGMACNAMTHIVPSGRLEGEMNVTGATGSDLDRPFGEEALSTDLLRVLIQRDVMSHKKENMKIFTENQLEAFGQQLVTWAYQPFDEEYDPQGTSDDPLAPLRARIQNCVAAMRQARAMNPDAPVPVYKARPLNGIWATAPFLHNGSVPTLDDLLKPQEKRPSAYGYLDGQMDMQKVGLTDRSGAAGAAMFNVYGEDGTVVTGNWNGGHEYGVALGDEQRRDLVEYVKGL